MFIPVYLQGYHTAQLSWSCSWQNLPRPARSHIPLCLLPTDVGFLSSNTTGFCLFGFFFKSNNSLVRKQSYPLQNSLPMSMTLPPQQSKTSLRSCHLCLELQNTLEASPPKPVPQQRGEQTCLPGYPGPCPLALHQDTELLLQRQHGPSTPHRTDLGHTLQLPVF